MFVQEEPSYYDESPTSWDRRVNLFGDIVIKRTISDHKHQSLIKLRRQVFRKYYSIMYVLINFISTCLG